MIYIFACEQLLMVCEHMFHHSIIFINVKYMDTKIYRKSWVGIKLWDWGRCKERYHLWFQNTYRPSARITLIAHWLFLMIIQIFYWCLRPKIVILPFYRDFKHISVTFDVIISTYYLWHTCKLAGAFSSDSHACLFSVKCAITIAKCIDHVK